MGVGIAWILGLCVDVIQGALLGQHALGFAITAYIAIRFHQRVRVYRITSTSDVCWHDFIAVHEFVVMDLRYFRRGPENMGLLGTGCYQCISMAVDLFSVASSKQKSFCLLTF